MEEIEKEAKGLITLLGPEERASIALFVMQLNREYYGERTCSCHEESHVCLTHGVLKGSEVQDIPERLGRFYDEPDV